MVRFALVVFALVVVGIFIYNHVEDGRLHLGS
jgi:hypothetical protein